MSPEFIRVALHLRTQRYIFTRFLIGITQVPRPFYSFEAALSTFLMLLFKNFSFSK